MNNPILKSGLIPFTTSSGIHGPPIAEWTIMNWLVFARNYNVMYEAQKQHKWDKDTPWMQTNYDQVGKKVGILGYGSIGRQSMSDILKLKRNKLANNCQLPVCPRQWE